MGEKNEYREKVKTGKSCDEKYDQLIVGKVPRVLTSLPFTTVFVSLHPF